MPNARRHVASTVVVCLLPMIVNLATAASAAEQKIGAAPEASNMRLVGSDDLQGRSAYQPTIQRQGDRYIAYIGHHGGTPDEQKPLNKLTGVGEFNGTSILDVTDPTHPKLLKHIPGQEGSYEKGGAQMVRICPGSTLPKADPAKFYMLRVFGGQAHEIWDVTDPTKPNLITRIPAGRDTHKNWWECDTGIAYLISGLPGWRTPRMTSIYDLSDPTKPVHIRDFGLPGQEPGSSGAEPPVGVHGPISTGPGGNRVYFGYGTNMGGVLQIIDRDKLLNGPKEPTPANLRYPVIGQVDLLPLNGAHTTFPMLKMPIADFAKDKVGKTRDIVMIVNEQILKECEEPRQMVFFADVTVETRPMIVSNYSVPEEPGSFCGRGGRFGAHSSNESTAPIYYKKVAFVTWFNAGVRAIDIRDPYRPKEIGYFIPPITEATDKRCIKVDGKDRCKVAIQSNNVETDDRGYVYVVDRANTGLHIVELTDEAKRAAGIQ